MDEINRIKENLVNIRKNIEEACKRSRRSAESVRLLIATKYADIPQVKNLYNLGLREFGENRAEELLLKSEKIENDAVWHFIGHLQTNKIKKVIPVAEYIHSIDSIKTISAIDSYCKKINKIQKVLVEINLSGEASKYGLMANDVNIFFKDALKYNNIDIKGLMTMAPLTEDSEAIRKVFANLRIIKENLEAENRNLNLKELSMGMSNDYIIAIEEGSTIIRLGSAVFR